MKRPEEPLTTSYLSHKAFKECKRLWLYRYAPDRIVSGEALWEVIREGRLLPTSALLGRVVDDVITAALRFRKRTGRWPHEPASAVRKVLGDYVAFSRDWANAVANREKWPRRSDRQAIDRLYYGEEFDLDEIEELISRGEELVKRWFNFPLVSDLDALNVETWRIPEGAVTPHFLLGDVKVFAKFDFMTVEPERVRIFDWKTGSVQRGEQGAREQLHGYADYARHALDIPLSRIELFGVWLSANFTSADSVDEGLIESLEAAWTAQARSASASLSRLAEGTGDLETEFPLTEQRWLCRGCVFRACPQHPKQIAPEAPCSDV